MPHCCWAMRRGHRVAGAYAGRRTHWPGPESPPCRHRAAAASARRRSSDEPLRIRLPARKPGLCWFAAQRLDARQLQPGTGFDHLTYLLEAAAAGLGVAIAPEDLAVSTDIASGRLLAPWGFVETGGEWALCALRGNTDAHSRIGGLAARRVERKPRRRLPSVRLRRIAASCPHA